MKNSEKSKEEMRITRNLYREVSRSRREIPGYLFETPWEAMSDYKLIVSDLTDQINRNGYIRLG